VWLIIATDVPPHLLGCVRLYQEQETSERQLQGEGRQMSDTGLSAQGGMGDMGDNGEKAVLSVRGAGKSFPAVKALQDVDFDLRRGEIHALLGENGAGKSTLIKVITGVHPRDAGAVLLDGQEIDPRHPGDAQELGISTVYQEVNLVPTLSVAENLMLERQTRKFGLISWKKTEEDAQDST